MFYQQENRLPTTSGNNNASNNNNGNNNNRTATQVLTQANSHLGQHYRQQQSSTIRGHNDDSSAQTISSLKDTLISLQYRIKMLQSQIQLKMQRQECFTLLDRKANTGYVKKIVDEIYGKMDVERDREEKKMKKLQEEQCKKLQQMKKKLKQTNSIVGNSKQQLQAQNLSKTLFSPTSNTSSKHMLIRPQQLFLQSNETMFSMLVDEINSIKHNQQLIQRLIQSKHKKTVGLNNQVCRKLQTLQREMEEMVKYVDWMGSDLPNVIIKVNGNDGLTKAKQMSTNNTKKQLFNNNNNKKTYQQVENNFITYHSNSNNFYAKKAGQVNNKKLVSRSENQPMQQQYHNSGRVSGVQQAVQNVTQVQSFQSIRLQLFSKSLQSIQKQLSLKLNIKDLLPFIKQNIPNLGQPILQIKQYIQQNLQSMRKILQSQSQINEQLTRASRIAWFHCYEKFTVVDTDRGSSSVQDQQGGQYSLGYILFGQQLVNVMPQCIQVDKQSQYTLRISIKGWYMIRVFIKQPKHSSSSGQISSQESNNDIELMHSLWIEVNGVAKYPLMMGNYRLLNLGGDNFVRVITQEEDVFVEIRKL